MLETDNGEDSLIWLKKSLTTIIQHICIN